MHHFTSLWTPNLNIAVGMGLMLATIWICLGTTTNKINDHLSIQWAIIEHLTSWCMSSWNFLLVSSQWHFLGLWVLCGFLLSSRCTISFLIFCVFMIMVLRSKQFLFMNVLMGFMALELTSLPILLLLCHSSSPALCYPLWFHGFIPSLLSKTLIKCL